MLFNFSQFTKSSKKFFLSKKNMSHLFRIGTAGDKGKWQRFGWGSLIEYTKQRNVEIVYNDANKPIVLRSKLFPVS